MSMSNRALLSIIRKHRDGALGAQDSQLTAERRAALDHYYGRPYGNEVEGRSQVVMKRLADTIDLMLANLMPMFIGSGNVVEFAPRGEEDEEQARQESDYLNHVLLEQNDGFGWLYAFAKDGLLLKNGYVKHYWDTDEDVSVETYTGLTQDRLIKVLMDLEGEQAEVKVLEQAEREELDEASGLVVPVFDIKLSVVRREGRAVIEAVPAEEIRVSRSCRGSVRHASFVEHVTYKTRSQLIEMGMSRQFVEDLPAYREDRNSDEDARDSVGESDDYSEDGIGDKSQDEIEYCEAYLRVDYDGDGVAELRRVVSVGGKIPPGKEWNAEIDCIPISSWTPNRVPHRHIGLSIDDSIDDVSLVETTLTRLMLDSLYLTVAPETVVSVPNVGPYIGDWLTTRPGGVKRTEGPIADSFAPYVKTPIMGEVLPALGYLDQVSERRTGVGPNTRGLDPDTLKQTTADAAESALRQANRRVEMVARLLAEGVRDAALAVHALLIKHADRRAIAQLRGEYVEVDPREWKKRKDLRIRVGLGTGSMDEKIQKVTVLSTIQASANGMGLLGPAEVYASASEGIQALGFNNPERFVMNPEGEKYRALMAQKAQQPQPTDPMVQATQIQAAADGQKAQLNAQVEVQKAAEKARTDALAEAAKLQVARESEAAEDRRARDKLALEKYRIDLEAHARLLEVQAQIDAKFAAEQLKAQVSLLETQVSASQAAMGRELDMVKHMASQKPAERAPQPLSVNVQSPPAPKARKKRIVTSRGPDGSLVGEVEEID